MKFLLLVFSSVFSAVAGHASTLASVERPITETEARAIIEQRVADQAIREANRKAELEAMSARGTRTMQTEGHRVTINRVEQPQLKAAPVPASGDRQAPRTWTAEERAAMIAAQPEQQSISLSATVYGEEYSRILWRKPRNKDEPRSGPEEFEIWTNVDLNYLRPIAAFEHGRHFYQYFGFTEAISLEEEAARTEQALKRGFRYESRWRPAPVEFSSERPEYVVFEGEGREAPPELYRQMDALFAHYLENETALKAEAQRNQALAKARAEYLKENPPQPKEVIVNHWPVTEGASR